MRLPNIAARLGQTGGQPLSNDLRLAPPPGGSHLLGGRRFGSLALEAPPELSPRAAPPGVQPVRNERMAGADFAPSVVVRGPGINTAVYDPSKGTHVTDGLGWGTKTAQDIMAKPGTAVLAPTSGTVIRHGSAQGGDSLYFKADDGRMFWMGHIDSRYSAPVGARVKAGSLLSRISSDHAAPHLHIDVR